MGDERKSRNVLAGTITIDEAREVFGSSFEWPHSQVHVGLTTLAMGDLMAVEFAQCSHTSLCLRHGVAKVEEMLSLHGSVPRGLLSVRIVVDDLVILEQVLRGSSEHALHQSDLRVAAARAGYDEVGLLSNPRLF